MTDTDAVRSPSVVRSRIDELDEAKLGCSEKALKLRRVDYVPFQGIQFDFSPDLILKLVPVLEAQG